MWIQGRGNVICNGSMQLAKQMPRLATRSGVQFGGMWMSWIVEVIRRNVGKRVKCSENEYPSCFTPFPVEWMLRVGWAVSGGLVPQSTRRNPWLAR